MAWFSWTYQALKAWSWIPMFSLLSRNPCHRNYLVDLPCRVWIQECRSLKNFQSFALSSRALQCDFPPSELHSDQACNWPWGLLFSVAYPSSGSFHHDLMIDHQGRLKFVVWFTHVDTLQVWNRLQVEAKSVETSHVIVLSLGSVARSDAETIFVLDAEKVSKLLVGFVCISYMFSVHLWSTTRSERVSQPGGRWTSLAPYRSLGTTRMRWEPGKWRGMVEFWIRSARKSLSINDNHDDGSWDW